MNSMEGSELEQCADEEIIRCNTWPSQQQPSCANVESCMSQTNSTPLVSSSPNTKALSGDQAEELQHQKLRPELGQSSVHSLQAQRFPEDTQIRASTQSLAQLIDSGKCIPHVQRSQSLAQVQFVDESTALGGPNYSSPETLIPVQNVTPVQLCPNLAQRLGSSLSTPSVQGSCESAQPSSSKTVTLSQDLVATNKFEMAGDSFSVNQDLSVPVECGGQLIKVVTSRQGIVQPGGPEQIASHAVDSFQYSVRPVGSKQEQVVSYIQETSQPIGLDLVQTVDSNNSLVGGAIVGSVPDLDQQPIGSDRGLDVGLNQEVTKPHPNQLTESVRLSENMMQGFSPNQSASCIRDCAQPFVGTIQSATKSAGRTQGLAERRRSEKSLVQLTCSTKDAIHPTGLERNLAGSVGTTKSLTRPFNPNQCLAELLASSQSFLQTKRPCVGLEDSYCHEQQLQSSSQSLNASRSSSSSLSARQRPSISAHGSDLSLTKSHEPSNDCVPTRASSFSLARASNNIFVRPLPSSNVLLDPGISSSSIDSAVSVRSDPCFGGSEHIKQVSTHLTEKEVRTVPKSTKKKRVRKKPSDAVSLKKPNPWGDESYSDLIAKALEAAPDKRLKLNEIYQWFAANVPYFGERANAEEAAGWKNSIRHNLSLHSRFMRIQNEGAGKSSWWVINPDAKPGRNPRRQRSATLETTSKAAMDKKRRGARKKVMELRAGGGSMHSAGNSVVGSQNSILGREMFGDNEEFEPVFRPRTQSNLSIGGSSARVSPTVVEDFNNFDFPPFVEASVMPHDILDRTNEMNLNQSDSPAFHRPMANPILNGSGGPSPSSSMVQHIKTETSPTSVKSENGVQPPPSYHELNAVRGISQLQNPLLRTHIIQNRIPSPAGVSYNSLYQAGGSIGLSGWVQSPANSQLSVHPPISCAQQTLGGSSALPMDLENLTLPDQPLMEFDNLEAVLRHELSQSTGNQLSFDNI